MTYIASPGLQLLTMSALTVKQCLDYLKYVLTELIPIASYTDRLVMLNETMKLKEYVNDINYTCLSIGTVLCFLVNDCMMLLYRLNDDTDFNQTQEGLICTLKQALAILNGPQDARLAKTKALLTVCQDQMNNQPLLLHYVQNLLLAVGAISSRKEEELQDLNILEWVIAFLSTDLKNKW